MGIVTAQTFPFCCRTVDNRPLFKLIKQCLVACRTQFLTILQQQPFVACQVRIVALIALLFGDRRVGDAFFKEGPVVAVITTDRC